jgi:hypothetical protein
MKMALGAFIVHGKFWPYDHDKDNKHIEFYSEKTGFTSNPGAPRRGGR